MRASDAERIRDADQRLAAAISAAEFWVANAPSGDGMQYEQELRRALADGRITNAQAGQEALKKLQERRAQFAEEARRSAERQRAADLLAETH